MQRFLFTLSVLILIMGRLPAQPSRIDFRFDFIQKHLAALGESDVLIPSTIRFADVPDERRLNELEQLGVRFHYHRGARLGTRTVFPVEVAAADTVLLLRPEFTTHPAKEADT